MFVLVILVCERCVSAMQTKRAYLNVWLSVQNLLIDHDIKYRYIQFSFYVSVGANEYLSLVPSIVSVFGFFCLLFTQLLTLDTIRYNAGNVIWWRKTITCCSIYIFLSKKHLGILGARNKLLSFLVAYRFLFLISLKSSSFLRSGRSQQSKTLAKRCRERVSDVSLNSRRLFVCGCLGDIRPPPLAAFVVDQEVQEGSKE